jgi:hypothetical protein
MVRNHLGYAILAAVVLFCAVAQNSSAVLVTYFNFNDGNETSDPPGIQPSTITQNNVTPSFVTPGSILNIAAGDPVTGTTGNSALRLTDTNNGQGNPKTFQFSVSTVGLQNLSLSYATRASTGFTQTLSYSVNGGAFVSTGLTFTPSTTGFNVASFDLSGISAINGQTTVTFQIAMAQNGQLKDQWNDFDNIQLNAAVAVPEPATVVGGALALAALGYMQRSRLRSVFRTRWKRAA